MATTITHEQRLSAAPVATDGTTIQSLGAVVMRYGLVLVVAWIGAMKFTAYEAEAIHGLVANSPLMGWVYSLMSVQAAAALIGTTELIIATLVGARLWSARASALGSALAVGMFLGTLSFLFSTPGVAEASLGGFPALSVLPGQFLLKDIVLIGVAVWSFGEAWSAAASER